MSSVDELMNLHCAAKDRWAGRFDSQKSMSASRDAHNAFFDALTATLAEKDQRIAELEATIADRDLRMRGLEAATNAHIEYSNSLENDDRRRFVDECAMRLFIQNCETLSHAKEDAQWAYDAAEALATERDRRMQG